MSQSYSLCILMTHQAPLFATTTYIQPQEHMFEKNIITDRGSKYSVTITPVTFTLADQDPQARVKSYMKTLMHDKYYRKATHNSLVRRVLHTDGAILEWMDDGGETGAAKCIQRELQLKWVVDCLVIVTRYFWGVMLHGDRFRHVVDATRIAVTDIVHVQ